MVWIWLFICLVLGIVVGFTLCAVARANSPFEDDFEEERCAGDCCGSCNK